LGHGVSSGFAGTVDATVAACQGGRKRMSLLSVAQVEAMLDTFSLF
jgi:hypothetical protein